MQSELGGLESKRRFPRRSIDRSGLIRFSFYYRSSRSIEIINLVSGRNFIGIDPSSVFGFIEFVRVSKYARVSSFSALRVSSARVSSRKNGYSTSFFERPFPLPSLLLEN